MDHLMNCSGSGRGGSRSHCRKSMPSGCRTPARLWRTAPRHGGGASGIGAGGWPRPWRFSWPCPTSPPAAAAAMAEIPVLGSLVEIVTFHRYAYDDGHSSADVTVPELSGGQSAQAVSGEVQAYTDRLLAEFQAQQETVGEGYQGLYVTSSVVTDTPEWFTLRIDATRTQASGYDFSRFYHIDKTTDETVVLADLFREDADYAQVLSEEVQAQMASQTAADPSVTYFPDQLTIPADQN